MIRLFCIEGFSPCCPKFTDDETEIKSDSCVTEGYFISDEEQEQRERAAAGNMIRLMNGGIEADWVNNAVEFWLHRFDLWKQQSQEKKEKELNQKEFLK